VTWVLVLDGHLPMGGLMGTIRGEGKRWYEVEYAKMRVEEEEGMMMMMIMIMMMMMMMMMVIR